MTALVAASPSPFWYATRGSGVVTLLLLTATLCLGVLTTVRWHSGRLPRFVVAGFHRNLTLLAVAFLAVHVTTTIADGFAPIGLKDAVVPFLSPYRPLWLGLGTLACDLLIAVVVTSLLRARLGRAAWRATHWLAYAAWPLALVHSLGTGSDARFGWMAVLAFASIAAVAAAVLVRIARGSAAGIGPRLTAGAMAVIVPIGVLVWYRDGPARHGWAARAGTPASILHSRPLRSRVAIAQAKSAPALPLSFDGRLTGSVSQAGPDGNGLVTILIDTTVRGGIRGTLRLSLEGVPIDEGGVSMTSSGVAFAAAGSPLFEGSITGLDGNRVTARVSAPSGGTLDLALMLDLDPVTGTISGQLHGARAGSPESQ
jgi:Ferric reductase like transmembrane component